MQEEESTIQRCAVSDDGDEKVEETRCKQQQSDEKLNSDKVDEKEENPSCEHYHSEEKLSSYNEQEAYAASTAIMGETVFDSPNRESELTSVPQSSIDSGLVAPPGLTADQVQEAAPKSVSIPDVKALSVGIMAQGLSWARRQRERRQRHYLKNQAEMQLQKLRKAQEEESNVNHETSNGLFNNATFQNLIKARRSPTNKSENDNNANGGIRAFFTKRSSDTDDDNDMINKSEAGGISVEIPITADKAEEDEAWIPPVRIEETTRDTMEANRVPYILSKDEMQQIAVHVLPRGIAYCRWQRLYSLGRDGDSFDAALRAIGHEKQTLMVVRTSRNARFGGFADSPWEQTFSLSGATYFGGPNGCLYRIDENPNYVPDDETNEKDDEEILEGQKKKPTSHPTIVKYYKWTGANRYVQLCDPGNKMIAFGGGGDDGAFGLCVQQDFQVGSTGPCATFGNEPLCDESYFEIVDMEVWGFLIGQF